MIRHLRCLHTVTKSTLENAADDKNRQTYLPDTDMGRVQRFERGTSGAQCMSPSSRTGQGPLVAALLFNELAACYLISTLNVQRTLAS